MKALYIVVIVILLAGCAPSPEELTATAAAARAQTQTAAPTRTATPTRTPTSTPKPTSTATLTPTNTPEPTPAAIGETVQYDDLEITLLEVATHSHIVTGGYYYYYSKPGEIYVDVAVLVKNSGTSPVDMTMQEIYIVEETGDSWYANFYGVKTVDLEKHLNPFASIKLEQLYVGGLPVSFEKNTYLRLVWYIKQNQDLIFGIQDSPQFVIPVE